MNIRSNLLKRLSVSFSIINREISLVAVFRGESIRMTFSSTWITFNLGSTHSSSFSNSWSKKRMKSKLNRDQSWSTLMETSHGPAWDRLIRVDSIVIGISVPQLFRAGNEPREVADCQGEVITIRVCSGRWCVRFALVQHVHAFFLSHRVYSISYVFSTHRYTHTHTHTHIFAKNLYTVYARLCSF